VADAVCALTSISGPNHHTYKDVAQEVITMGTSVQLLLKTRFERMIFYSSYLELQLIDVNYLAIFTFRAGRAQVSDIQKKTSLVSPALHPSIIQQVDHVSSQQWCG